MDRETRKVICGIVHLTTLVPFLIFNGFVFVTLWRWFMVPLELPVINLAHGIGISVLISFSTYQTSICKETSNYELFKRIMFNNSVYPAMILLTGWIISYFM